MEEGELRATVEERRKKNAGTLAKRESLKFFPPLFLLEKRRLSRFRDRQMLFFIYLL